MANMEAIRRIDSMPHDKEAQREAHEIILGPMEAVIIKDEDSGSEIRLRAHNLIKVFVGRNDGHYVGFKPMFDGRNYPYNVADKKVIVTPMGQVDGHRRRFEISRDRGVIVQMEEKNS